VPARATFRRERVVDHQHGCLVPFHPVDHAAKHALVAQAIRQARDALRREVVEHRIGLQRRDRRCQQGRPEQTPVFTLDAWPVDLHLECWRDQAEEVGSTPCSPLPGERWMPDPAEQWSDTRIPTRQPALAAGLPAVARQGSSGDDHELFP
jgi:hypothetical protein